MYKYSLLNAPFQVQEVAYVDGQRNVAVTFGERDVKADVNAKHK